MYTIFIMYTILSVALLCITEVSKYITNTHKHYYVLNNTLRNDLLYQKSTTSLQYHFDVP